MFTFWLRNHDSLLISFTIPNEQVDNKACEFDPYRSRTIVLSRPLSVKGHHGKTPTSSLIENRHRLYAPVLPFALPSLCLVLRPGRCYRIPGPLEGVG